MRFDFFMRGSISCRGYFFRA